MAGCRAPSFRMVAAVVDSTLPAVGCGAFILRNGYLLLIQRLRAPEAGCWGLPGGRVEPFEGLTEAVRREIREETGLEITLGPLLCIVEQSEPVAGQHWVSPVYQAYAPEGGEARLMEPHKHAALGWYALDALPSPLTRATEEAVAVFRARESG